MLGVTRRREGSERAQALRVPDFRRMFAALVTSSAGDWLEYTALIGLFVYQGRTGAIALAGLALVRALPAFFGPIAGVWADRLPDKSVLVACDIARAIVVVGMVQARDTYLLLMLVALEELFSIWFGPSRQIAIRRVVPDDLLYSATALTRIGTQVTRIAAPAVGAFLVGSIGVRNTLWLDALSFVVSALFLSRLTTPDRSVTKLPREERKNLLREVGEGLQFVFGHRLLRAAVLGATAIMFALFLEDAFLGLLVTHDGMPYTVFGWVMGGISIGNIIGATGMMKWGKRLNPLAGMSAGAMFTGLLTVLVAGYHVSIGFDFGEVIWALIWGGIGASMAGFQIPYRYLLQHEPPAELVGRVSGTTNTLVTFAMAIAPLIGAELLNWLGITPLFIIAGGALALVGLSLSLAGLRGGHALLTANETTPPDYGQVRETK